MRSRGTRADGDAVEERVGQQPDEREHTDPARHHGVGMRLLAEVEVRRQRVLREVDDQVADEHRDEAAGTFDGVGQHAEHDDGEQEAGAEARQRGERAAVAAGTPEHEERRRRRSPRPASAA
jgi:hypothetical protein